MKTPHWAATPLIAVLVIAGCDTAGIPFSDLTPPDDQGAQQSDDGSVPPVGEDSTETNNVDSGDDMLALSQEAAIAAAVDAAAAIARSVAAILPAKDLQAIFESGLAPPICPILGTELDSNTILLTLNYDSGCNPGLYPSLTFAGTVSGTSFIAFNTFDLAFEAFTVRDESMDGTIAGGFIPFDGQTTFAVSVDLVLEDGMTMLGDATVEVEEPTGILAIIDAAVQVNTVSSETIDITFAGLRCDAPANGNFTPEGGSATLDWLADSHGSDVTTMTIEFTAQTPVDGSVNRMTSP